MSIFRKVSIGSFLSERTERYKPIEANELKLKRIEKIDFKGNIHLVPHKQTNTNMILIKKGDLVISGINAEKGAVSVYKGDEDVTATIHYSSYEYDENKIDIDYLKWYLKSDSFKKLLIDAAGGGIKTELKAKKFLPLEIFLPSLQEQKEIVRKIEAVEFDIENISILARENYNLLTSLRKAILRDAIMGKLVSQDEADESATVLLEKIKQEKDRLIKEKKIKKEKPLPQITNEESPFDLPKGWEWTRLGDIADISSGSTPLKSNPNYYKNGQIPWCTSTVTGQDYVYEPNSFITETAVKECNLRLYPIGTLIMAMYGQGKTRGQTTELLIESTINQACAAIQMHLKSSYLKDYIKICLKEVYNKIREEAVGGAQPNLNGNKVKSIIIALPPLNEQKRIVEKVNQLIQLCDELEANIDQSNVESEKLMKAVLQEAFRFNEKVLS